MGKITQQSKRCRNDFVGNSWNSMRMSTIMYVALLIGIIISLLLLTQSKQIKAVNETDLEKFVSVLQDENIMVTEWSVYAREMLPNVTTKKELNQFAGQLKKRFPEWNWFMKQAGDQIKVTGHSRTEHYDESIDIILDDKSKQGALFSYNMKGDRWDEVNAHIIKNTSKSRIHDIFRQNTTIFSCVKGVINDNIEKDLSFLAASIMQDLDGEEIEKLAEDTFISVTAYSPHLTKAITHHENDINLQLGIRKDGLGLNTAVVIGTPIITIEY